MQQKKQRRGQASVLIIFSLIPIFTLFAFVVNMGMLVNAKISLQNAADFAAYAGAATQARQLTQISHLNYQMRQTYKKFLFRYYVLGNVSLKCFPGNPSNSPDCNANLASKAMVWTNPNKNLVPRVPSVCINMHPEANPCRLDDVQLMTVTKPACLPWDPVCQQLSNAADAIRQIQQTSCTATSVINQEILTHWLYGTTYDSGLQSSTLNLKGLINDIGLVTEEMLLKVRIDNIVKLVNAPAQKNVTIASLRALEEEQNKAKTERTILAFKSAVGNLNPKVFFEDTIAMQEIIPSGGGLLKVEAIQAPFKAFYTYMDGNDPEKCAIATDAIDAAPYMGVYKSPDSLTYYAVRLTAKAQLLFNPFPFTSPDDGIELTAYSAAMPFGSRIGPKIEEKMFVKAGKARLGTTGQITDVNYPFLRMSEGLNGQDYTWEDTEILASFFKVLRNVGAANGGGTSLKAFDGPDLARGLAAAALPDRFEVGKYNIPVDTTEKSIIPYYARPNGVSGDYYSMWAPVIPVDEQDNFSETVRKELDNIIPSIASTTGNNRTSTQVKLEIKTKLDADLAKLFVILKNDPTKGFKVARIPDPLSTNAFSQTGVPNIPGKILDPSKIASSYATQHDYNYYLGGRDGYSVKFVPFDKLLSKAWKISNSPDKTAPKIVDIQSGDLSDLIKVTH